MNFLAVSRPHVIEVIFSISLFVPEKKEGRKRKNKKNNNNCPPPKKTKQNKIKPRLFWPAC